MLSPVAVADTDLGTYSDAVPLANMINQSGVDTAFISGTTDFDTYFTNPGQTFAAANYRNNWQSQASFNLPLTGYIDFDLGASHHIDKLAMWNISLENVGVTVFEDLNGSGQTAGEFTLVNHLSFPFSYPVDILEFGTPVQGRYIRLTVNSVYTLPQPNDFFGYATIGEVVVSVGSATAAPEVSIALDQNGDLVVTFTGTLQWASRPGEPFQDVPTSPVGTYIISEPEQADQQLFRSRN